MTVTDLYNLVLGLIENSKEGAELPTLDTLSGTDAILVIKSGEITPYTIRKDKITFSGEPATTFLALTDTESTYTGQEGKVLFVKTGGGIGYKTIAEVTGITAQGIIDALTYTPIDDRLANLASDLSTAEQNAIKTKLNVTDGGGVQSVTGSAVDNTDPLNPIINTTEAESLGIKKIDINKVNALHPKEPIVTPTYDGSGQATHPSVLYFNKGFNGYKYWMAHTPYALGDETLENPSILVSNDPHSEGWSTPPGLTNPVVPYPGAGKYNADTNLIQGLDNKLYMYYIESNSPSKVFVVSSSDGITWSAPVELFSMAYPLVNPNVIIEGSTYIMYYINRDASPRKLEKITSSSPDSGWSMASPVVCTVSNIHSEKDLWHFEIRRYYEEYHIFQCFSLSGQNGSNTELYFGSSKDGINFNTSDNPLLSIEAEDFISDRLYKGTGVLLNDHKYAFWYGVVSGSNEWRVAYTEVDLTGQTVSTSNDIYELNSNTINPEIGYITENKTYQGKFLIAENLDNAYLLGKLDYTGKEKDITSEGVFPIDFYVKNDGTKLFTVEYNSENVNEYAFGTPYDPKTLTLTSQYTLASMGKPTSLTFSEDGMRMFLFDGTGKEIKQYNLNTAWTLSGGVTYFAQSAIMGSGDSCLGMTRNASGNKIILGRGTNLLQEVNLSDPADITTATLGNSSVMSEVAQLQGLDLKPDGKSIFVIDSSVGKVKRYNLSTPEDVTTKSISSEELDASSQQGTANFRDFQFANNGRIAFAVGYNLVITSYK